MLKMQGVDVELELVREVERCLHRKSANSDRRGNAGILTNFRKEFIAKTAGIATTGREDIRKRERFFSKPTKKGRGSTLRAVCNTRC